MERLTFNILVLLFTSLLSVACYSFTGIPAHGGGKRFYEEQKLLASSVQNACEQLNTKALKNKKVHLSIVSLETSGGGQVTYPNNGNIELEYGFNTRLQNSENFSDSNRSTDLVVEPSGDIELNPTPQYRSFFNRTNEDVNYLVKAIEMKMEIDGIQLQSRESADVVLNILVNALGTKSSTLSTPVKVNESLEASCDLTYYATDLQTSTVIVGKKRASSIARYDVDRIRFTSKLKENYSLPEDKVGHIF